MMCMACCLLIRFVVCCLFVVCFVWFVRCLMLSGCFLLRRDWLSCVTRCVLFAVVSFVVCWLVFNVCCSLLVVRCSLSAVCVLGVLFVVR